MKKRVVKLSESDLERLVKRVILEEKRSINEVSIDKIVSKIKSRGGKVEPQEEEKLMDYVKNKLNKDKDFDINITQKGFNVTKGSQRKKIFGFDQIGNMVKYINEGGEPKNSRYMFFSNLEQINRQTTMLMEMDENTLSQILENGHDWAQDHIAEAKNNMDQVFDFIMNEIKDPEPNMEGQSPYYDDEENTDVFPTGSSDWRNNKMVGENLKRKLNNRVIKR
jgi:hypothetical protein